MTSSPSSCSMRSMEQMNGWRTSLTRSRACSSCSARTPSTSRELRLPYTNLMALKSPPGASHFQTSPKPPLPKGSMRRYPGMGSALASRNHVMKPSCKNGKWLIKGRSQPGGCPIERQSKKLLSFNSWLQGYLHLGENRLGGQLAGNLAGNFLLGKYGL